ncbi:MAG: DtxR family transcriptional regulator [Phaeodactylibacter sp.]|nr:DtxR family transcriptional regulator [Phaeodactylibacter sp.]MCB9277229.1 DtxR family transcriptional regulator [Lewinellaceae bacterium]
MLIAVNPEIALLIGGAALLGLALTFWPKNGLLALLARGRLNTQRVLLEDALKFLFDCEYKSIPCRLNSIAGNLHISADSTARLLDRLRAMGLIQLQEDTFRLTDAGRSYALRIVRVHRIWERYLADETGVGQMDWHGEADFKEHLLSPEAADQLAAQMGNPAFDPHGDPIPSSKGEMPVYTGKPLSALKEGDIARIVHIEDEPAAIYAQIAALGLYPGMQVYIMDVTDERIQFAANGEECVLTPLFATNITVESLPAPEPIQKKADLLSALKAGESALVKGISPTCRGQQRRRLMDLGIVPGTAITTEFRSASGDPVAYRVLGTTIAIRRSQADQIFIDRQEAKP